MVAVYFLLKDGLDIKSALLDAESKAAGIAPLLMAKILVDFDYTIRDTEINGLSLWLASLSRAF